jgi:hypothetical protein
MEHADVSNAFDMVLAKIQETIDALNSSVIESSQAEEFEQVQKLAAKGQQIVQFRERVLDLQTEWNRSVAAPAPPAAPLPPDTLTSRAQQMETDFSDELDMPEPADDDEAELDIPAKQKEDFYVPILGALIDLGGTARADEVLEKLEDTMAFGSHDLKARAAGPIRWKHIAHQARHDLVHEKGFLSPLSPRGVWEITEAGRNYLARNAQQHA